MLNLLPQTLMNTLNVRSHLKERLLEDVQPQNVRILLSTRTCPDQTISSKAGDVAWPLGDGEEAGEERRPSAARNADIPFPMFVRKVSLEEDVESCKPGATKSLSLTRIDLRPSPNGPEQLRGKSPT